MADQLELELGDPPAGRPQGRPDRLPRRPSVLLQPARTFSLRAAAKRRLAQVAVAVARDGGLSGPDDAYFDAWAHAHYDATQDGADDATREPARR
jgi:hypothetical protein